MSLQNMTRFTPDRLGGRGENQRGRYVQTCKESLETSGVELWNPKGHEQLQLLLFILAVPELISLGGSSQVPPFSLHVPSHASTATCTRITHTGSWNFGQNLPQASGGLTRPCKWSHRLGQRPLYPFISPLNSDHKVAFLHVVCSSHETVEGLSGKR